MLSPGSLGAQRLMAFLSEAGLAVWFMEEETLARAFELVVDYANVPMDLADASLVVAAEVLGLRRVFTIDRKDFDIYRIKRGHRRVSFEMLN